MTLAVSGGRWLLEREVNHNRLRLWYSDLFVLDGEEGLMIRVLWPIRSAIGWTLKFCGTYNFIQNSTEIQKPRPNHQTQHHKWHKFPYRKLHVHSFHNVSIFQFILNCPWEHTTTRTNRHRQQNEPSILLLNFPPFIQRFRAPIAHHTGSFFFI